MYNLCVCLCVFMCDIWHIDDIYGDISRYIDIIILKGILSSCQAFLGAQCAVLKAFMLPWRRSKWQLGWPGRVLGKLHWKGDGSFHGFEHVQIPLPTLWLLPHFCVCFQKGEGQERAELVPKGGVSGRCEDFKIIKHVATSSALSGAAAASPPYLLKPALEVFLASETKQTHFCVSNHLIFLLPNPSLGIPDY